MNTPIDTAFAELCAKHDLTALDVGMSLGCSEARRFISYAHFGPGKCEQGMGDTASAALANAIAKVNAKRSVAPEVPTLSIEAQAA